MNTIRDIHQINEQELQRGIAGTAASWHTKYSKSAWVYVGNLDHALTEGDVICVLSQYGEIDDLHLVRDEATGASRGFAFCKYSDTRSCVLAVDNFCGIQLCGRSLRVDHVENYRLPKHILEKEEQVNAIITKSSATGHAYLGQEFANEFNLERGQDLFAPPPPSSSKELSTKTSAAIPATKNRDENDESSIQRKERKRARKEAKHRKRSHKEDRKREPHRRSRDRDDHDDDASRKKKKRKHRDR